ncbi:MAG: DUF429 domain-containing protein [Acidimicrobiia bacterium]
MDPLPSSTPSPPIATASKKFVGVDGCRAGWIAISITDNVDDVLSMTLHRNARDLAAFAHETSIVAIDMPIGLSETGRRACDAEARRMLGRRGVTVFNAPPRNSLGAEEFSAASALSRAAGGHGISIQTYNLLPRIRDLDDALTSFSCPVAEVHPEVSFTLMTGAPLPSKKTLDGRQQRRDAIASRWPEIDQLLRSRPSRCAVDDVLDAAAVLWSALRIARGCAMTFGDGAIDARGIAMVIRA